MCVWTLYNAFMCQLTRYLMGASLQTNDETVLVTTLAAHRLTRATRLSVDRPSHSGVIQIVCLTTECTCQSFIVVNKR